VRTSEAVTEVRVHSCVVVCGMMSHHHTLYVTSSYIVCHIMILPCGPQKLSKRSVCTGVLWRVVCAHMWRVVHTCGLYTLSHTLLTHPVLSLSSSHHVMEERALNLSLTHSHTLSLHTLSCLSLPHTLSVATLPHTI